MILLRGQCYNYNLYCCTATVIICGITYLLLDASPFSEIIFCPPYICHRRCQICVQNCITIMYWIVPTRAHVIYVLSVIFLFYILYLIRLTLISYMARKMNHIPKIHKNRPYMKYICRSYIATWFIFHSSYFLCRK